MSSKREKISFESVNGGNYKVIDKSAISQANQRVKEEMKTVVREYEKKETVSKQMAAKLVLNS